MPDSPIGFRTELHRHGRRLLDLTVAANPRLARAVVVRAGSPTLRELYEAADHWSVGAAEHLTRLQGTGAHVEDLVSEAEEAVLPVIQAAAQGARRYPEYFRVGDETALVLYATVRAARPDIVVETGVADGVSTSLILAALEQNGAGELHSIDIADDVGVLVGRHPRWRLHVVNESSWADDLQGIASELPKLDVFFHDSNHDRYHQMTEYSTFWPRMCEGGLFLSDDVDKSFAFLEFSGRVGRRPAFLVDRRKVFGSIAR